MPQVLNEASFEEGTIHCNELPTERKWCTRCWWTNKDSMESIIVHGKMNIGIGVAVFNGSEETWKLSRCDSKESVARALRASNATWWSICSPNCTRTIPTITCGFVAWVTSIIRGSSAWSHSWLEATDRDANGAIQICIVFKTVIPISSSFVILPLNLHWHCSSRHRYNTLSLSLCEISKWNFSRTAQSCTFFFQHIPSWKALAKAPVVVTVVRRCL